MPEEWTSLEITAPSVEEALSKGAVEFGLPEEALEVEVLDAGGKGLFGLGTRLARVRLTVRSDRPATPAPAAGVTAAGPEAQPQDTEQALAATRESIAELLERMGIRASVEAHWGESSEPGGIQPLLVDIRGDDLSILVGRRGETLAALQYVTRLIVGKEIGRPVAVVIDVEGYRARRERQLRQLARRMADQAVEAGRTMTLEPMPANERRIIHIELRDHPGVVTESIGEGDHRKVTIVPRP